MSRPTNVAGLEDRFSAMGNESNKKCANFLRSKFHRRRPGLKPKVVNDRKHGPEGAFFHRFYFSILFTFILAFAVTKSTAASAPCQGADPKHALDGLRPFITTEMQKA